MGKYFPLCSGNSILLFAEAFPEASPSLDKFSDAAAVKGVVDDVSQDRLQEREQDDLQLFPDVVSEKVEEVVDRLSKVPPAKQIVKMYFYAAKFCTDDHWLDLHEALLVDEHRGAGEQVQVVDLQPDVTITVKRN